MQEQLPLLSIIIPTYNSEKTLSCCLQSVLNQTFKDFEILIIDGLSSDNTINVIKGYNNSKIRVYSEKDKGIYDAMNKGIEKSAGEWLYFLGSDDQFFNEYVLEAIFQGNKDILKHSDYVYGNVIWG